MSTRTTDSTTTPPAAPVPGAQAYRYHLVNFAAGTASESETDSRAAPVVAPVDGWVIDETWLNIYVNGQELATLMCSPLDRAALTLGFLYTEAIIDARADVALLQMHHDDTMADVFVRGDEVRIPRRLILTAGCGGVTLADRIEDLPPLASDFRTTPDHVLARMGDLKRAAVLYRSVRGVHSAALAAPDRLLLSAEDIGRHNAVDKLAGAALERDLPTQDTLLLTSGRISSEMLAKAHRLGVPVVISRTAPTSAAVTAAEAWGMCLVGYARGEQLRVYTRPDRLGL